MTTPLGATLGFPNVIRSQFKIFVVAKCLNCSHTDRHTRRPRSSSIPPHLPPLTPSVLRGMRTSALNFAFGTRLNFPHIGHPHHLFLHPLFLFFLITPSQICSLLQTKNRKKRKRKKKTGRRTHFLPLKNKLNGKKKPQVFFCFFFYVFIYIYLFFKFKAQCLSVFQSVFTPRFSVRTWRHMSRTVCSYSFTSLLCAL